MWAERRRDHAESLRCARGGAEMSLERRYALSVALGAIPSGAASIVTSSGTAQVEAKAPKDR